MNVILSKNVISLFFFLACVQKHSLLASNTTTKRTWPTGGVIREPYQEIRRHYDLGYIKRAADAIPDQFDARDKWEDCKSIRRIISQGSCIFASLLAVTTVLTDRLCIMTKGEDQFEYSAEDLLACCERCGGGTVPATCEGRSDIMNAIKHVQKHGLLSGGQWDLPDTAGCKPISISTQDGNRPKCDDKCTNIKVIENKTYSQERRYCKLRVDHFEAEEGESVSIETIQSELMENGPLIMRLNHITIVFDNYTSGILQEVSSDEASGYHYVRLVGWGNDDGIPYWLIANSWGATWGDFGFGKIVRGKNFMDIESYIIAPFASITKEKSGHKTFLYHTYLLYACLFFTLYRSFSACI